jgi:ubiquinol-cytochrome c reductase iron-sulfur subunit
MSDDIKRPTDAELAEMSRDELVALGGKIDGVETVFKEPRWTVEGTKAEKRAERLVAR